MQPYPTVQNYGYNPYGSYQQQQYMPMDRLAQLQANYQNIMGYQQPQSQNIPFGLNGQMVDSIDVVKAKDVDMSGAVTYYPQSNGEVIYTKQLQPDGTSRILTYRISQDAPQTQVQQTVNMDVLNGMFGQLKQDLLSEINGIKDLVGTFMSPSTEPPKNQRGGNQK